MIHNCSPDIIDLQAPRIVILLMAAIPNDTNTANKGIEKIINYSDLKFEMAKLFRMREREVKMIPIVIGALTSTPIKLLDLFKQLGILC